MPRSMMHIAFRLGCPCGAGFSLRRASARLLLFLIPLLLQADLIDRIAVAVASAVITESEILRQIRITALLN